MYSKFATLPAELKTNIFAFIRATADQKTICLVCREWKGIMTPILWETWRTTRPLATLLDFQIPSLRFVHDLELYKGEQADPDVESSISLVLSVLPKNALKTFRTDMAMTESSLLLLLQAHQELRVLEAPLTDSTRPEESFFDRDSRLPLYLANIEVLKVTYHLPPNPTGASRFLLTHTPRLKSLAVHGYISNNVYRPVDVQNISANLFNNASATTEKPTVYCLEALYLAYLSFENQPSLLLKHIDFSNLEMLRLGFCDHTTPFLEALATSFEYNPCQIKTLIIVLPMKNSAHVSAIERLLKSFSGLRSLYLDIRSPELVDHACIAHHGPTLRVLKVSMSFTRTDNYYNFSDLRNLLSSCSGLKELSVGLGPLFLGDVTALATDFKLRNPCEDVPYASSEFESLLDLVATHPTLLLFRLPSAPTINYGVYEPDGIDAHHVPLAAALYQNLATCLVQYFAARGSNIKYLAFSPEVVPGLRPAKDANGHRWPRYYYRRGRSVEDVRGVGMERKMPVVAVPAKIRGRGMDEYPGMLENFWV